jgi:hypothetical protein
MAFLPTVALFLAIAADDAVDAVAAEVDAVAAAAEETVEETELEADEDVEEEEEEELEVEEAGNFAACAKGTTWAEEDGAQGYSLSDASCKKVHPRDCLRHPEIAACCPDVCRKEEICAGFESLEGPELNTCLNHHMYTGDGSVLDSLNPKYWFGWKASHGSCSELVEREGATDDESEINLCCNEPSARRLSEETDAEADAEAEDETEDEDMASNDAEEDNVYPVNTNEELQKKMCDGATTTDTTDNTNTDGADKEKTDEATDDTTTAEGTNSASTFGFTALALMLVTA